MLGGGSKAPDVKEQGLLKQLRCQRAWSMGSTGLTARVLFCVCKAREVVGDGPRRALNAWCPVRVEELSCRTSIPYGSP